MTTTPYALAVAGLLIPLGLPAQVVDPTVSGNYIVVGFGGTDVSGDVGRARQIEGADRGLRGGIEALHFGATKDRLTAEIDASGLLGENEYELDVRLRKGERFRINLGVEQSRTYYDGSSEANLAGGVFPATPAFGFVPSELHLDRSRLWIEAGVLTDAGIDVALRFEHSSREGDKSSTTWGTASGGNRKVAPALNRVNESTDTISLTVKKDDEDLSWRTGARWDHTTLENTLENVSGGDFYTRHDDNSSDTVSGHAYVKKRINDRLHLSVGGLYVAEDSNLAGYRYRGTTPFGNDLAATYTALSGGTNYKEGAANASLSWQPDKAWTITPSLRFTDSKLDGVSSGASTSGAGVNDIEWFEMAEAIEVRYRGFKDWSLVAQAESVQGKGEQVADLLNNSRDLFLDQTSVRQKYSASAHWYYRPGLSFSGQYYFKTTRNDNDPLTGSQDYYINFQRFDTHDVNFRVNWRPASTLSFITRYDYRVHTVDTRVESQPEIESSRNTTHSISESVTWQPLARLYLTGSVSLVRGKLELPISSTSPATNYVTTSDADYLTASLGAGYALSKTMDLNLDYSHYSADNLIDNSLASAVYGLDEQYDSVGVTWTIRPTTKVAYSLRYVYANYEENATLGQNDYEAHSVYARAQFNF